MKDISRWISFLLLFLILMYFIRGCINFSQSCSYQDKIEKVRALPNERLAKLYDDMKTLYESDIDHFIQYYSNSENGLPVEFSDLDVSIIKPKDAVIVIGGCVDNKAFLNFRGYKFDFETEQEIFMHWGDICANCNETIWKADE